MKKFAEKIATKNTISNTLKENREIKLNTKMNISIGNPNDNAQMTLKALLENSNTLADSIKPLENIKKYIEANPNLSPVDIVQWRMFELNKYKLSLFLNREIQQEILYRGEFVSNQINNDIVSQKFTYTEEQNNNLYLHKRVDNYFVLIHFKYLKPNKDRKRIVKNNNEMILECEKAFGDHMGVFRKLTGADDNPDYLEADKQTLNEQGFQYVEDYYQDFTPFYFNINVLNSQSETLQYRCFSQENQISVDSVRYFNPLSTTQFLFLKDLNPSQDNWDEMWREFKENSKEAYGKSGKKWKKSKFESEINSNGDYYAPVFYTLNKNLQEELVRFLYNLEVTPQINNFVRYLGLNRERREFLGWLYKIMNFVNI